MSQSTVKVEIPVGSPDSMITLADDVEAHHIELAGDSPLKGLNMDSLTANVKIAREYRDKAKKLHQEAESYNQKAALALGIDPTQNSNTPGTVYNLLASIRDTLLGLYRGQEEQLGLWGYKIVRGTVSHSKKSKAKE